MTSDQSQSRINGKFAPGHSGNPSGKHSSTGLVTYIKSKFGENLETLVDEIYNILNDGRTNPSNRLKAIELLFSRVYGAPKQSSDVSINLPEPIQFIPAGADETSQSNETIRENT